MTGWRKRVGFLVVSLHLELLFDSHGTCQVDCAILVVIPLGFAVAVLSIRIMHCVFEESLLE